MNEEVLEWNSMNYSQNCQNTGGNNENKITPELLAIQEPSNSETQYKNCVRIDFTKDERKRKVGAMH